MKEILIEIEDYYGNTEHLIAFYNATSINPRTLVLRGYNLADVETDNENCQHIRLQKEDKDDKKNN